MSVKNKQSGFTLVEIMVVVVILGLLAGFGAVKFMNYKKRADIKIAMTQCSKLREAIESWALDNPSSDVSADDVWDRMIEDKLVKRRDIKDPWGEEYIVRKDEDDNFYVISKGKDKSQDTDDDIYEDGLASERTGDW